MHLSSSPPGTPTQPCAASQIIVCGLYGLEELDRKVADACNRVRLLDGHFQTITRLVTEANSRGDIVICERVEQECARSAVGVFKALLELGFARAASRVGIGLKASTLAHFLPRFRDEAAEEYLLLMAAFADEVLAHYQPVAPRDEDAGASLWLESDDLHALTSSIVTYLGKRELLLVSLATAAESHVYTSVCEVPGEAEYLAGEDWLAAQLSQLAHRDFLGITELLALAGIIAALARQDPGAEISRFVVILGLKLCDTLLLHPAI